MPKTPVRPKTPAGVVLTPGAGAGRDHPSLVATEHALVPSGITVERVDFPYRLAGRQAPDRPPVLVAAVTDATTSLAEQLGVPTGRVAIGGRSMGGRMCSMAAAEGLEVAALVLISYPLHPPGKPERLRTEHFERISVPCLFVSGTKDSFGTPGELEAATKAIGGPVTHVWLEGGDHGLRRKDDAVAETVAEWLVAPARR